MLPFKPAEFSPHKLYYNHLLKLLDSQKWDEDEFVNTLSRFVMMVNNIVIPIDVTKLFLDYVVNQFRHVIFLMNNGKTEQAISLFKNLFNSEGIKDNFITNKNFLIYILNSDSFNENLFFDYLLKFFQFNTNVDLSKDSSRRLKVLE